MLYFNTFTASAAINISPHFQGDLRKKEVKRLGGIKFSHNWKKKRMKIIWRRLELLLIYRFFCYLEFYFVFRLSFLWPCHFAEISGDMVLSVCTFLLLQARDRTVVFFTFCLNLSLSICSMTPPASGVWGNKYQLFSADSMRNTEIKTNHSFSTNIMTNTDIGIITQLPLEWLLLDYMTTWRAIFIASSARLLSQSLNISIAPSQRGKHNFLVTASI